jgi:hypothetical protein
VYGEPLFRSETLTLVPPVTHRAATAVTRSRVEARVSSTRRSVVSSRNPASRSRRSSPMAPVFPLHGREKPP